MRRLTVLFLAVATTISCSDSDGQLVERAPVTPGAESSGTIAQDSAQLPPGHPPMNGGQMMMSPNRAMMPGPEIQVSMEGQRVTAGAISFEVAPGWQSTPPASSMRAAQFMVPPVEGDPEAAELVLFADIGGSAQQNVERWIGQFQPASSQNVVDTAVGPFSVKTLEAQGTYTAGGMMMGGGQPKENFAMLAAVAEGPGGPWYFKFTGPAQTIAANKDEFNRMIQSLQANQ